MFYIIGFLLFVFFIYRWEVIDELIEQRKPRYPYICWLEEQTAKPLSQFVEEHTPGARSIYGLRDGGLYIALKVFGCENCSMINELEIIPCYKHELEFVD